jgi:hypothetical protein
VKKELKKRFFLHCSLKSKYRKLKGEVKVKGRTSLKRKKKKAVNLQDEEEVVLHHPYGSRSSRPGGHRLRQR